MVCSAANDPISMNSAQSDGPPARIVFAAFKGFGDLLSAAPTIISELNSGNRVTLFVFPQLIDFLALVDFGPFAASLEVAVLPTPISIGKLLEFFKSVSRLSPDLVWISPHAVQKEASWKIPLLFLIAKWLYWPAARIAGASSEPSARFFDDRVPVDRSLPLADREWIGFCLAAGRTPGDTPPRSGFGTRIYRNPGESSRYDVVVHPGASWENKKWPIDKWVRLITRLSANYKLAVLGLESEVAELRWRVMACPNVTFVVGSIETALRTIAAARVAVTMDSGAMHFAAALQVPTIALFGPTDPAQIVASTPGVETIYRPELSCQSCWTSRCQFTTNFCMMLISDGAIETKVRGLLGEEVSTAHV